MTMMRRPGKRILIILVGNNNFNDVFRNLREVAYCLAKLFCKQCQVHTSQKVYQSLQSYSSYTRMWGEEKTLKIMSGVRKSFSAAGRSVLLSAAIYFVPYNWEKDKIPDEDLERCEEEYEGIGHLCRCTVYCNACHKRQIFDKKVRNIDYCKCSGSFGHVDCSQESESWEPFLERENILVWRKLYNKYGNHYAYKVYAEYSDLSASAFLEVQLNSSLRTQWDPSALELKVVSSHPQSNSELLYWLVKFPPLFSNRDYVFKRRFRVNERKKEVVIMNEVVDLPQVPEEKGIHRVKEYWSKMVIRARDSFHEPGMSYTLTYFDNPGTSLPSSVKNFVASSAFPDFLSNVHKAAINLQNRWEGGEDIYVSLPTMLRHKKETREIYASPELEEDRSHGEGEREISTRPQELHGARKNSPKIPLKFNKAVVDLLEAIEVMSPDYDEKTILISKVEKLVDSLNLNSSKKRELVKKLEFLINKTKGFMKEAAKKREKSLEIMNELERKHYYDQSSADEPSILLFQSLLQAVTEILKADINMRTGKDLAKTDHTVINSSSTFVAPKQDSHSKGGKGFSQAECLSQCCHIEQSPPTEMKDSYWSYVGFLFSWWGYSSSNSSSSSSKNDPKEQKSCVCKQAEGESESSTPVTRTKDSDSSQASLLNSYDSSTCENPNGSNKVDDHSQRERVSKPTEDDSTEEQVTWVFLNWLYKFLSKLSI